MRRLAQHLLPTYSSGNASAQMIVWDEVPAQQAVPAVVRKRREHTCKKKKETPVAREVDVPVWVKLWKLFGCAVAQWYGMVFQRFPVSMTLPFLVRANTYRLELKLLNSLAILCWTTTTAI